MAFYSSLTLFYPGAPPIVSVAELRKFATLLRKEIGVEQQSSGTLNLKWGERIDSDYEDTNQTVWHESGVIGVPQDYPWDIEANESLWDDIWNDVSDDSRTVYRAYVSLGDLTNEASKALSAHGDSSKNSNVLLDCASIEINPVCPRTLAAEELTCTGLFEVNFSGYGYFSWRRDFSEYATQYESALPVSATKKICRKMFPVAKDERFERIDEHLGNIFLNRNFYQKGDWMLTVLET